MPLSRKLILHQKARDEQKRCKDWLLPFLSSGKPKFATKAEFRVAAMKELDVSKNSFEASWIMAIEATGRHDWYEPLRKRAKRKSLS